MIKSDKYKYKIALIYTVLKIIKTMKNAISTKYKILKGKKKKKKNLKPRITKLTSSETALNEAHSAYVVFT